LKKFDERRADIFSPLQEKLLTKFVKDHQYPTVMEMDQKSSQRIFAEKNPAVVIFVESATDPAVQVLRDLEKDLKGKILLAYTIVAEGSYGKRISDHMGIKEALPALRIVEQKGKTVNKYKNTADPTISVEAIVAFYNEWKGGKLVPFFNSEEIPEKNDAPVKVIVAKSWKDIVLDPTKDVLVEFYAPWCGHCKKLAPVYDKLAKKLLDINPNMVLAKMDATANEVEGHQIGSFPTLKLFTTKNKKKPEEFKGDKTEEGILTWLKEKSTVGSLEKAAEEKKADL